MRLGAVGCPLVAGTRRLLNLVEIPDHHSPRDGIVV